MERPSVKLTPAESYLLLWKLDGGDEMLWNLRHMRSELHEFGRVKTIGPGAVIEDPHERFRLAQKTALSLLEKGLVAVRKVIEPYGEGELLPTKEARHKLKNGNNWLWPGDREREFFFTLELTAKGEAALRSVRREDIPMVPGRVP